MAAQLLLTCPARRAWAVDALREAARDAMATSAADAAITYLRRALSEPPEASEIASVFRELGAAEAFTSDSRAVEHLREAVARTSDPVVRAEIALELADVLDSLFRTVEACAELEKALAGVPASEGDLRARLEAALISESFFAGETIERGATLLSERAGRLPPGASGRSMRSQLALVMALSGEPAREVGEMARAALDDADERDLWTTWVTALPCS